MPNQIPEVGLFSVAKSLLRAFAFLIGFLWCAVVLFSPSPIGMKGVNLLGGMAILLIVYAINLAAIRAAERRLSKDARREETGQSQ